MATSQLEAGWPGGHRVAVCLTFDVDAESGFLGDGQQYERRLTTLSEGRFGVTRGLPRILDMLGRHGARATFFVPGYTAQLHPEAVAAIVGNDARDFQLAERARIWLRLKLHG
jgi:peptidoglycan-N-acetylglucosamine deacetylase